MPPNFVYGESDVMAHVACEFGERATGGSGEERGKAPSGITSLPPDISLRLAVATVPIKCFMLIATNERKKLGKTVCIVIANAVTLQTLAS